MMRPRAPAISVGRLGRPPAASWLVVPDSSRRDDPRRSARDDAAEAMHPTMPGATMAANSQRRSSSSMMTINACAAMGATSVIIGRADDPRTRRSRLGRACLGRAARARIRVPAFVHALSVERRRRHAQAWGEQCGRRLPSYPHFGVSWPAGGTRQPATTRHAACRIILRSLVGQRAHAPGLWLPEASSLNSSRFFASSSSTDEPTPDTL